MKSPYFTILFMLMLCIAGSAQTSDRHLQAEAVSKYPELGVEGSDFNRRFLSEYNNRRVADPTYFKDPRWPIILADEVSLNSALKASQNIHAPLSKPTTPDLHSQTTALPSGVFSSEAINVKSSGFDSRIATEPSRPTRQSMERRVNARSALGSQPPATSQAGAHTFSVFQVLIFGLIAVCALPFGLFGLKKWRDKQEWMRQNAEANAYFTAAERLKKFPEVPTAAILQATEQSFFCNPSDLYEPTLVRDYQSGFAGFKISRRITIGGSRGRSLSVPVLKKADSGMLTITNKRLLFSGAKETRSVILDKITSVIPRLDAVQISIEARDKSMVITASNPLILAGIIRKCSLDATRA